MPKNKGKSAYEALLERENAAPVGFVITSKELFAVFAELYDEARGINKTNKESETGSPLDAVTWKLARLTGFLSEQSEPIMDSLLLDWTKHQEMPEELSISQRAEIEENLREPYFTSCNLTAFRLLLPLAKLMYEIEKNGNAVTHAFKLAVIFETFEKAVDFLKAYFAQDLGARVNTLHNAMLMAVPQDTGIDWSVWREICYKFMSKKRFDKRFIQTILPRAKELQDLIIKKSAKQPPDQAVKKIINEKIKEIDKIYSRYRDLEKKDVDDLSLEEEAEFLKLTQTLREERLTLVEMGVPFTKQLTMTELSAYLESLFTESYSESRKIFDQYGLTQNDFNRFIELERVNDDVMIPDILIDGELIDEEQEIELRMVKAASDDGDSTDESTSSLDLDMSSESVSGDSSSEMESESESEYADDNGVSSRQIERELRGQGSLKNKYKGFYLMKIDVTDEVQAARAACLGRMTDCCQSMSGEAGEACAIQGITQPDSGFYILCKGDVTNRKITDKVIAQCWAWRSVSGAIVFDSIETWEGVEDKKYLTKMVVDFYQSLARRLVINGHTSSVHCGDCGIKDITRSIGIVRGVREQFINYRGYCDSSEQVIIADKDCPVFWYTRGLYWQQATDNHIVSALNAMNSINAVNSPLVTLFLKQLNLLIIGNKKNYLRVISDSVSRLAPKKEKLYKKIVKMIKAYSLDSYRVKKGINHGGMINELITKTLLLGGEWNFIGLVDEDLRTLLHWSVIHSRLDGVKALIEAGVDLNAVCSEDYTALEYAIDDTNFDICAALIRAGAKITVSQFVEVLEMQPRNIYKIFLNLLDKKILQNILRKPKYLLDMLDFLPEKNRLGFLGRLGLDWVGSMISDYADLISLSLRIPANDGQLLLSKLKSKVKISSLKTNKLFSGVVSCDLSQFESKLIEWQQSLMTPEILSRVISRLPIDMRMPYLNILGLPFVGRLMADVDGLSKLAELLSIDDRFTFFSKVGLEYVKTQCKTQIRLYDAVLIHLNDAMQLSYLKLLGLEWFLTLPKAEGGDRFDLQFLLDKYKRENVKQYIEWLGVETIFRFYESSCYPDHVSRSDESEYRKRCLVVLDKMMDAQIERVKKIFLVGKRSEGIKELMEYSVRFIYFSESLIIVNYLLKSGVWCDASTLLKILNVMVSKDRWGAFISSLDPNVVKSFFSSGSEFLDFLDRCDSNTKVELIKFFGPVWIKSLITNPQQLSRFINILAGRVEGEDLLSWLSCDLSLESDRMLIAAWIDSLSSLQVCLKAFPHDQYPVLLDISRPLVAGTRFTLSELFRLVEQLSFTAESAYLRSLCACRVHDFADFSKFLSQFKSDKVGMFVRSLDTAWIQSVVKSIDQLNALLLIIRFFENQFIRSLDGAYLASLMNAESAGKSLNEAQLLVYFKAVDGSAFGELMEAIKQSMPVLIPSRYQLINLLGKLPVEKMSALVKALCPDVIKRYCESSADLISILKILSKDRAKLIVNVLDEVWLKTLLTQESTTGQADVVWQIDKPFLELLRKKASLFEPAASSSSTVEFPGIPKSVYAEQQVLFGGENRIRRESEVGKVDPSVLPESSTSKKPK